MCMDVRYDKWIAGEEYKVREGAHECDECILECLISTLTRKKQLEHITVENESLYELCLTLFLLSFKEGEWGINDLWGIETG